MPFKIYPKLDIIPLPPELREIGVPALRAVAEVAQSDNARLDLRTLSELLHFSAGVTRRRTFPGGEIYFRAAACTGALYEIELYFACGPLPELDAGLYHYAAGEFGLRRLRAGDFRRTGGGDQRRVFDRAGSGNRDLHGDLLAECVEISGAHLSPLWLG